MYDQTIPKIIIDDSDFLSSLEEDYLEIFTENLPSMLVDVNLLDRFYSGEFEFSNEEYTELLKSLHKINAGRIHELVFYLLIKNHTFEEINNDFSFLVDEERRKIKKFEFGGKQHKAIGNGYLNLIKFWDVTDDTDSNDHAEQSIITAAEYGHLDIVKYLLEQIELYDNPILRDQVETVFSVAAEHGHLDILKYIVEMEHKYGKVDELLQSAFTYAIEGGHVNVLKYLISLENKDNKIDIHGFSERAIHSAVSSNNLDTVKYIVSLEPTHGKINLHHQFYSIYVEAIKNNNLDIIKYLVSLEPLIDIVTLRQLSVEAFSWNKDLEILKYLLNLELETYGRITMHTSKGIIGTAIKNGRLDVIKYLFSLETEHSKIDIHMSDDLFTKLAIACGYQRIIDFLLSLEPTHGKIDVERLTAFVKAGNNFR